MKALITLILITTSLNSMAQESKLSRLGRLAKAPFVCAGSLVVGVAGAAGMTIVDGLDLGLMTVVDTGAEVANVFAGGGMIEQHYGNVVGIVKMIPKDIAHFPRKTTFGRDTYCGRAILGPVSKEGEKTVISTNSLNDTELNKDVIVPLATPEVKIVTAPE